MPKTVQAMESDDDRATEIAGNIGDLLERETSDDDNPATVILALTRVLAFTLTDDDIANRDNFAEQVFETVRELIRDHDVLSGKVTPKQRVLEHSPTDCQACRVMENIGERMVRTIATQPLADVDKKRIIRDIVTSAFCAFHEDGEGRVMALAQFMGQCVQDFAGHDSDSSETRH